MILRILDHLLRGLDVGAATATRAYGLLNMIVAQRPALVVLDVNLPGLDGPSLVSLVRGDPEIARTTIVLHSSLDERALGQRPNADVSPHLQRRRSRERTRRPCTP